MFNGISKHLGAIYKLASLETLHELFEKQYIDLREANDIIAERIRALATKAPGTFREYEDLTILEEATNDENAEQMVQSLLDDHEKLNKLLHDTIDTANESGDDGTADLLTMRSEEHEKHAWMLRSFLGK